MLDVLAPFTVPDVENGTLARPLSGGIRRGRQILDATMLPGTGGQLPCREANAMMKSIGSPCPLRRQHNTISRLSERIDVFVPALQIKIEIVPKFWFVGGELQHAMTVAFQILQGIEIVLQEHGPT